MPPARPPSWGTPQLTGISRLPQTLEMHELCPAPFVPVPGERANLGTHLAVRGAALGSPKVCLCHKADGPLGQAEVFPSPSTPQPALLGNQLTAHPARTASLITETPAPAALVGWGSDPAPCRDARRSGPPSSHSSRFRAPCSESQPAAVPLHPPTAQARCPSTAHNAFPPSPPPPLPHPCTRSPLPSPAILPQPSDPLCDKSCSPPSPLPAAPHAPPQCPPAPPTSPPLHPTPPNSPAASPSPSSPPPTLCLSIPSPSAACHSHA